MWFPTELVLSLCYKRGSCVLRKKELSGQRKFVFSLNVFYLEVGGRVVVERGSGALQWGVCGRLGSPWGRGVTVICTVVASRPPSLLGLSQPRTLKSHTEWFLPPCRCRYFVRNLKAQVHTPSGTGWGLGSGVALRGHPSSLLSPLRCPERSVALWRGLSDSQSGPRAAP